MNTHFSRLLSLAALGITLQAEVVNDGAKLDNLTLFSSANAGFDTVVQLAPVQAGANTLLEAALTQEGIQFFPPRHAWILTDAFPTGSVYTVSSRVVPAANPAQGVLGVVGWAGVTGSQVNGIAFALKPTATTSGWTASISSVDLSAETEETSDGVAHLFNIDGGAASAAAGSATIPLPEVNAGGSFVLELGFEAPTAAQKTALPAATAQITAKVFQVDSGGARTGIGAPAVVLTDLPLPSVHRVGLFGYRPQAFGTGVIGQFDDLSLVGQFGRGDNRPPVVSLTAPQDGLIVVLPDAVSFKATASDPDGEVRRVEFYAGTTKVGEVSSAPYEFNWVGAAPGAYELTAKVIDERGASGTSTELIGVLVTTNKPPTVSITSPVNGAVLADPALVEVTATAADPDGTVSSVDFFLDGTLIGTDTTAPYSAIWFSPELGQHILSVVATDARGATNLVPAVATVEVSTNAAPSVRIVSPADGAVFEAPATVEVEAVAEDSNGVSEMRFFLNGQDLGRPPVFTPGNQVSAKFTFVNLGVGNHEITVNATDSLAASGSAAAPLRIRVVQPTRVSLSVTAQGGNVLISWPAGVTSAVLQSTDAVGSGVWTPVAGVTGNTATVPASGKAKFFRLLVQQ